MHPTAATHSIRIVALLSILGLALGTLGCGDPSPEEQLADATQELATAAQAKEGAKTALDQLDQRLADAQAARDKAAEAYEGAVDRWREAKDAVGQFATDEVLHQQVNRALLDAEELQDATITARVDRRVVTLIGGATEQADIETAKTLADEIPGVVRVTSQVVLESANPQEAPVSAGKPSAAPASKPQPAIDPLDEPAASTLDPEDLDEDAPSEEEAAPLRERQI